MQRYIRHIGIGLVSGLLNGLFGAGGGSVVVPAMETFLGMDEKKSHATAIGIIFLFSLVSSAFYIRQGYFDWKIWIPVTIGGMAGGLTGAKFLAKIPKHWLKIVFGSVILVTAGKLIF